MRLTEELEDYDFSLTISKQLTGKLAAGVGAENGVKSVAILIAAIPLFLMGAPLLTYSPFAIFRFKQFLGPFEHLIFFGPFAAVTLLGVALVTHRQAHPQRPPLPSQGPAASFLHASAWGLWLAFLASYLTLALPLLAYLQGDFQSARELMAFPGVGVLYRLYMVAFPVLLFYERGPTVRQGLLLSTAVLTITRSVIYSERSALIELVAVLAVCHYFHIMRVRPRDAVGAGLLAAIIFVFTFTARIEAQARRDPSNHLHQAVVADGPILAAINSSATYYADTQNKAYGILLGGLPRYHTKRMLQVFNMASAREDIRLGVTYASENAHTGYTASALTNPGGLTEDVSDFGVAGVALSMLKFLLAAAILVRAKANRVAFALLPFLLTWALEYPRFNYYYLPFVAALIACSIAWAWFSYAFQGRPRAVRRRAPVLVTRFAPAPAIISATTTSPVVSIEPPAESPPAKPRRPNPPRTSPKGSVAEGAEPPAAAIEEAAVTASCEGISAAPVKPARKRARLARRGGEAP